MALGGWGWGWQIGGRTLPFPRPPRQFLLLLFTFYIGYRWGRPSGADYPPSVSSVPLTNSGNPGSRGADGGESRNIARYELSDNRAVRAAGYITSTLTGGYGKNLKRWGGNHFAALTNLNDPNEDDGGRGWAVPPFWIDPDDMPRQRVKMVDVGGTENEERVEIEEEEEVDIVEGDRMDGPSPWEDEEEDEIIYWDDLFSYDASTNPLDFLSSFTSSSPHSSLLDNYHLPTFSKNGDQESIDPEVLNYFKLPPGFDERIDRKRRKEQEQVKEAEDILARGGIIPEGLKKKIAKQKNRIPGKKAEFEDRQRQRQAHHFVPTPSLQIPSHVHYIFGLSQSHSQAHSRSQDKFDQPGMMKSSGQGPDWGFIQHLSLLSTIHHLKPRRLTIWIGDVQPGHSLSIHSETDSHGKPTGGKKFVERKLNGGRGNWWWERSKELEWEIGSWGIEEEMEMKKWEKMGNRARGKLKPGWKRRMDEGKEKRRKEREERQLKRLGIEVGGNEGRAGMGLGWLRKAGGMIGVGKDEDMVIGTTLTTFEEGKQVAAGTPGSRQEPQESLLSDVKDKGEGDDLRYLQNEGEGSWFESGFGLKGRVEVRRVPTDLLDRVWGREVEHFAHKADILRLLILHRFGGIYLDSDILVLRPFTPLLHSEAFMGMETQPDMAWAELDQSDEGVAWKKALEWKPSGLCNAIVGARPYSPFIARWIESFQTFDKSLWAMHSVAKPWEIALQNPHEITVLNKNAFFWPLWHGEHLELVHRTTDYDFESSGQFAYHLWASVAWSPYLASLDPERIFNDGIENGESSFTRAARKFVTWELRSKWRDAKSKGEVS